jgi:hypothetical protein
MVIVASCCVLKHELEIIFYSRASEKCFWKLFHLTVDATERECPEFKTVLS